MKKTLLSIFAMCGMLTATNAQTYEWASQIEGVDDDQSLSVSSQGADIYSTGSFQGSTDLDPSSGILSLNSNGGHDVYVQKLDQNGNFLWGKTIGGLGHDLGRKINDYGSTIIVSGTFQDTVDFDPGVGVVSHVSNGGNDVFILALDNNGNFLWVKTFGGSGNESIGAQEIDSNDDIVITGGFTDSLTFNVGGAPTTALSSSGTDPDVYIIKMEKTTGDGIWIKTIGGTSIDAGSGLAIKSNDNIVVAGRYRNIMDVDPSTNNFSLSSQGGYSVFLAEYDNQGDFVNGFSFDNSSDMEVYDIELDVNENIYLTGPYKGTADFDLKSGVTNLTSNGGQDVYVVKLTSAKDLVWVKTFGGIGLDQAFGIKVNTDGDVYTCGHYSTTVDFDPGTGTVNHTSVDFSTSDIFIHKLDSSGDFEWVHTFGGSSNDVVRGLELDANENMYVSGYFVDSIDFDPTTGIDSLISVAGSRDAFLLKFSGTSVGIDDLEKKTVVNIYPNPVKNKLFFELENEKITRVTIIDITGKTVKTINGAIKTLNVSDLKQGIYFLQVQTEQSISTSRFIKQ